MLPDLAGVHPGDKVFHVAGHQEGGVQHWLRANAHVAGLNQRDSALHALSHLGADLHDNNVKSRQSTGIGTIPNQSNLKFQDKIT